jgi:hypothetical protein
MMEVETVQPITKQQVCQSKQTSMPPEVIEAFNELIIKNINSDGIAIVKCNEVEDLIIAKLFIESKDFDYKWLDIEPIFENFGWKVRYNSPSFANSHESNFKFS